MPLVDQARQELGGDAMLTRTADLRYRGQSYELTVPADGDLSTTVERFHALHLRRYGYAHRGKGVELITLGLRARLPAPYRLPRFSPAPGQPWIGVQPVWFADGWRDVPVLQRARLVPATLVEKPALIVQEDTTVLVPPRWRGMVDEWGSLVLDRKERS